MAEEEAFQCGAEDHGLKQTRAGVPVAEVIRKAGISEQTFYRSKAKYAGLEVDQVRQIAQLQELNGPDSRTKRGIAIAICSQVDW